MENKESSLADVSLALSCTNLLQDNSLCSSDNSPKSQLKSPKLLKSQPSARWKNAKHECDTIDYYLLRDIIKELTEKCNYNETETSKLEQAIFKELKCLQYHHDQLRTRVSNIIHEIYHDQPTAHIAQSPNSPNTPKIWDGNVVHDVERCKFDNKLIRLNDAAMHNIKNEFNSKIRPLLPKHSHSDTNSIAKRLKKQCKNEGCMRMLPNEAKNDDIVSECPCLERVCVFLHIYHTFDTELNTEHAVNIANYLQIDEYDHNRLRADFLHIHAIHMTENHRLQKEICRAIKSRYPCFANKTNKCYIQDRHTRFLDKKNQFVEQTSFDTEDSKQSIHNIDEENSNDVPKLKYVKSDCIDIAFSELCDTVHCYFLHSKVQYGCHFDRVSSEQQLLDCDDELEEKEDDAQRQQFEFIGSVEDKKWMDSIAPIDINYEQRIYDRLLSKMGVFRWQGAHGFRHGQSQDLAHLKATYKNVKAEVLNNKYWRLSISNWNTTVAKVIQFHKSFASEKMRTDRASIYHDQIMGHKATWNRGETPTIKEITVIKLYTDWDSLQSELKKCFRLESVDDIVESYSPSFSKPGLLHRASAPMELGPKKTLKPQLSALRNTVSSYKLLKTLTPQLSLDEATYKLKERLCEFFNWRGSLLVFINKFSEIILPTRNNREHILYHGVNRRMILNPSSTQSFYGPLSTTSSYYVAQTFASDKGMILAVSSKYPRLGMCNAFDASPISDYPEEQEWLIGHIYLRIRRVYTKVFTHAPLDSKLRYAFFALHLFREQMFSMNPILETYIIPFIQIHLRDVMLIQDKWLSQLLEEDKENKNDNYMDYKYLQEILKWRRDGFKTHTPRLHKTFEDTVSTPNEVTKKSRIFYILIKKFNEFVTEPNLKQILRMDCISPGLRPYFLKKSDESYTMKTQHNGLDEEVEQIWYQISFKKLITFFPNTEQIHFLNWYKFDNVALKALITQIKRKENKIKVVKFLYYDYKEPLEEHQFFFDDKKLDKTKIEILSKLDWTIDCKVDKTGYSIKLKYKI